MDYPKWYEPGSPAWMGAKIDLADFGGGLGKVEIEEPRRELVNDYDRAFADAGKRIDDDAMAYLFKAYVKKGYEGMPGRGATIKQWLDWLKKMQNKPVSRLVNGILIFRTDQEPEATEAGKE